LNEEVKKITYENEGVRYDATKFSSDGKALLNYMVDINQEIGTCKRRIDILQAASITFNSKLKEHLTDDMVLVDAADYEVENN
jgi:hypothetical protein